MKIAIIGASGMVGSRIRDEAISRGHFVTGIARRLQNMVQHANLKFVGLDAEDVTLLADELAGHDLVILAVKYNTIDVNKIFEAIKLAGLNRVAVVGGAGSLEVAPGLLLRDTKEFNPEWQPESDSSRAVLNRLREEKMLEWIYLSPSAYFFDGDAKGEVRFGRDQLLIDQEGNSSISTGDYAIAMMDEVEDPKHLRERFTVGY